VADIKGNFNLEKKIAFITKHKYHKPEHMVGTGYNTIQYNNFIYTRLGLKLKSLWGRV